VDHQTVKTHARREFLRFLAASPLLPPLAMVASALQQQKPTGDAVITAPGQALDVFDFEAVAKERLPPAHWGYLATGTDDDATIRANREGFDRFQLRVRRLVDIRQIDMSITLFGETFPTPLVLAPVGSQKAFHDDGELASARAAKTGDHLMMLSTVTSTGIEDVVKARGKAVWFQLYPTDQWSVTQALVKRTRSAGAPALALTVDLQGGSNRLTAERFRRIDTRQCSACHKAANAGVVGSSGMPSALPGGKPMYAGLDLSLVKSLQAPQANWEYAKRLRDLTPMKFLIKGIVSREDAELAVQHGVDGVIVSNHGGRAENSGRGTIESLVEVVEGVRGRIPIIVDGGFRRGVDVFKALALGANAIMIGRPYVWGLASFGQPGVEAVLDILSRELRMVMRQAGTARISDINRSYVIDRR
jgi:isopentenyl diphosphate isomerase/L-lactate dehydrogenase-like FMN-dependent dehydrogenase